VGIFGGKAHSADRFLRYQGQSEAGTVIRLKDRCPGFGDPAKPKTVLSIYQSDEGTGDVMQSYVHNLSVDVGTGNPGAVGLRFMSNNIGAMDYVTIRSSDPKGAGRTGLDLSQGQNGPCFIKRVTVIGFDQGVDTGNSFSLVLEHLTLKNQNVVGFRNEANVTIRGLRSENRVPVIENKRTMMLVDAQFSGGDAQQNAINNQGRLYVRDLNQTGYGASINAGDRGVIKDAKVAEWSDAKGLSLFGAEPKSLRLPVEETPDVPWETDLNKWAKVEPESDALALQAVIDDAAKKGKTTLYFPQARYRITEPVRVHGSINRIIGMACTVDVADLYGKFKAGAAVFTFENLQSDTIVVERFWSIGGWKGPATATMFANKSGKTVVLKDMGVSGMMKQADPGGRWFIEDISFGGPLQVGKGEQIWARQFNPESPETDMIHVDGGQLWILGMKTEGRATHAIARNGAKLEIIGGISYQSWVNQPIDPPMFKIIDSDFSVSYGFYVWNQPFSTIVEETLGGQTRKLPFSDKLPDWHLPIYRSGGPVK